MQSNVCFHYVFGLCQVRGVFQIFFGLQIIRECKRKSIFVYFLFTDLVSSLECFSSNGQSKKWDDDGELYQCKVEPGAVNRHCVKFTKLSCIFR